MTGDSLPETQDSVTNTYIVDQLIEERAVRLRQTAIWPLIRAVVYPILGYDKAVSMADALAGLSGEGTMDWSRDFLDMSVDVSGDDALPETGPCFITANHPGGIADGIAVWQAIKARRADMVFYANRDAIRVNPELADHIIPVEWRPEHRSREKTRETLVQTRKAIEDGRCVVIFPAGKMSVWDWRELTLREADWMPTAAGLALKYKVPVIPLGIRQRMSILFYALGQIHAELKHMTVFHELLAKKGAHYQLRFGDFLEVDQLPTSDTDATVLLKAQSEILAGRINA